MPYDAEYSELLPLFIKLIESQNGREIQPGREWLTDAQVLSVKLFQHLVSMKSLADGASIEVPNLISTTYIDHASIKVVARAALETYLVFFFIYGTQDQDQSQFRHNVWYYSGLADREKYVTNSAHAHEVLAVERQAMNNLCAEIKTSPYYSDFTVKQQRQLLKGAWRTGVTWSDLGINAGFHAQYFNNIYNYLCGYSHSSYASALQVSQAQSIEDQQMLARPILGIGVVLMSHFTFTYPTVFPDADAILAANPVPRSVAEKWRFGPEDMAEVYGG